MASSTDAKLQYLRAKGLRILKDDMYISILKINSQLMFLTGFSK